MKIVVSLTDDQVGHLVALLRRQRHKVEQEIIKAREKGRLHTGSVTRLNRANAILKVLEPLWEGKDYGE